MMVILETKEQFRKKTTALSNTRAI